MNDLIRKKWISEYSGVTDDGHEVPIEKVVPGCITNDVAFGYFKANEGEDVEKCWEWKFLPNIRIQTPYPKIKVALNRS